MKTTQPQCAIAQQAEATLAALRRVRSGVPQGEYRVDAEALRKARQGVPTGEYHTAR